MVPQRALFRPAARAFTLLELVAVLTIGLLLAYLSLSGYRSVLVSAELDAGAQRIRDTLDEARQAALTQNLPVEVRFYGRPDGTYGAVQLRWKRDDRTTPPVAPLVALPVAIAIDGTALHSTLVALAAPALAVDASDPRLDARTRVFHFLPDGSTDLDPAKKWLLTLRAAVPANPMPFPADWAGIGLDPVTGRVQIYRP